MFLVKHKKWCYNEANTHKKEDLMENIIEIRNLYKSYGPVKAVQDVIAEMPEMQLVSAVTVADATKCKVYLPWYKAYGERGGDRVPPYSAIVYDIEIVKIVK